MKVSLLGPLSVREGATAIGVQRPRQRAILAMLALSARKIVDVDTLVDKVWGNSPPPKVRNQIQVHISQMRKAFHGAGVADVLETKSGGYVLHLHPSAVDVSVFTGLDSMGTRALGEHRHHAAVEAFRLSLREWRGPALADIEAAFAGAEARLLEERRRAVFQRWVDLEIGLGRPERVLPHLFRAVHDEPFDEGLRLRLMAALQRAGRTADALAVYRSTRCLLQQELGIDPHETLKSAESAILRGEMIEHPAWRLLQLELQ